MPRHDGPGSARALSSSASASRPAFADGLAPWPNRRNSICAA